MCPFLFLPALLDIFQLCKTLAPPFVTLRYGRRETKGRRKEKIAPIAHKRMKKMREEEVGVEREDSG
ncbi:hypothetical protein CsSME_00041300 [Camellia sinensis var. sinensis]